MDSECQLQTNFQLPLFADSLFCDLPPKSLAALNRIKHSQRFKKRTTLFSKGESPCCIYWLREGVVQISLTDELKNKQFTRLAEPFEILSLTEAIINQPYEIGAETMTACVCECVGRDDFIGLLFDEPQICLRLAQAMSLNLQKSSELRRLFI